MKDYLWRLVIISIVVLWRIISWIRETIFNSKKYQELRPKLDNLENSIKEHESKVEEDRKNWISKAESWNHKIEQEKRRIRTKQKKKTKAISKIFLTLFLPKNSASKSSKLKTKTLNIGLSLMLIFKLVNARYLRR